MGLLITQLNCLENVGLIDESSRGEKTPTLAVEEDAVSLNSMHESSHRPGKEPIGVDDGVEKRARTPTKTLAEVS
ncbi:uncharacterized protein A4U43_C09F10340 [Asparagus officinalis]|uniref:Uncharacterized protein n=1 Tax=Asparagus officinalis TaxID=4686 RepID=A0A5P1E8D1_ASPOF|nr:uncharacterized protein A4U43_C09F10340 [Asparagus officinalis]